MITEPVDETHLVTLAGNRRPEANAENDAGPVADSTPMDHILLQLRRTPEQEQALEELIEQLYNPNSPNFHRWLTAQEFGARFGPAPEDLQTITAWLESQGFAVHVVYPSGMLIDFSGTAGQVRQAFHTAIHHLEVNSAGHIANMSEPQIPAALAAAVAGIVSLHDFRPHTTYKPRANYTFTSSGSTFQALVPADLATIYNLNPLFSAGISGQGQTVVVLEDTDVFSTSDWTTFRSTFGLSSFTSPGFTQVHPAPTSGSNNCSDPGVNGDDIEAILDAEWASAAAPSAAIELASCANTGNTFGGLIAIQNLVNGSSPPAIISLSYGECEALNGATSNATYNSAYQQAVTEGVSVFVSAGDEGAASCDADKSKSTHGIGVSAFASTPYNVAVGGTDYSDTFAGTNSTYWNSGNTSTFGSALSYIPEIPWNNSCAGVLLATFVSGSGITYGSSGFCNTTTGEQFLTTGSGSGGPSGCATGTASGGVVGGSCAGYAKPSWQSVFGNPSDGVRDLPDISLFAANGLWGHFFVFCDSDTNNGGVACTGAPSGWSGAGGTSFSTPILAGIQALVNQKVGARQGNPNLVYYQLAATEYGASGSSSCNSSLGNAVASTCIFYDVTQGDMDVNCTGSHNCYRPSGTNGVLSTSNSAYDPAYGTSAGWDFATGIGTVNAANLVNHWPSSAPSFSLSANPTSVTVTQGGPGGPSTITVNPLNGFSGSVGLSASGLPTGMTATFNPTSTTTTSTLTLSASASATPGTVNVTVAGTSGSLNNSTQISLTVLAQTWSISGTISGAASSGVTVTLSGTASASTTTDALGNYSFTGLANGGYTVTPSLAGDVFSPSSQPVTVSGGNVPAVNFTAFSPIAQTAWSVFFVDSQETSCYTGAATNAIDGNTATMWHTQFCGAAPPTPHEIQINLGASYQLGGFQYLPRQDGSACGWINQYQFYVSTDGVNWGTPVASGNFTYGNLSTQCPGPGAGVPSALQIAFPAATGQYVRLRALSEINGNPWTSAAEIRVLGSLVTGQSLEVASVSLNPAIVVGGSSSTGTVTLSLPAGAGGAVVGLSSSNTAVAAVPASVTVPAGAVSATFTIHTSIVGSVTQVNISGSYNGSVQGTLTVNPGSLISQTNWSVLFVDSQETSCYSGQATNAIDGNTTTMWHTQFCGAAPSTPHEIQINLGASYSLTAFQYLPRQDASSCGWINQYQFYVSADGVNWGTPVASGNFNYGNLSTPCPGPGAGVPGPQLIAFPQTTGQFIRLRALSEIHGNPWTSAAEIDVLGNFVSSGSLALTSVSLNPAIVVGGSPSTGTVTLNGPAPSGGAVVTLSSNNAAAGVPLSVTVPAGSNTAAFPVTTSSVASATPVTIGGSYNGNQSATLTVNPGSVLAQTTWSILFVDSQETSCYNGAATNAIDGNTTTLWHTQFCGAAPPTPHEIQINLGASHSLTAFQYLPRQDGSSCGWINQYEFYVSTDGVNWGTPVASGNFNYGNLIAQCPGPGAGVPPALQIAFPETTGRYVRLRAVSEINGNPWTSAAEIDVLGQ